MRKMIPIIIIACIVSFVWGYINGKEKGHKKAQEEIKTIQPPKTVAFIDGKCLNN